MDGSKVTGEATGKAVVMTVAELKAVLRGKGMPVTGANEALRGRLRSADK